MSQSQTQHQVTYWRDLPSMVVAKVADQTTKALLAPRFQEAIDEAAMRMGDTGAEDYLAGWRRTEWIASDDDAATTLEQVVAGLEEDWPQARIDDYLDALAPEATA